jgi:hypothetical protein
MIALRHGLRQETKSHCRDCGLHVLPFLDTLARVGAAHRSIVGVEMVLERARLTLEHGTARVLVIDVEPPTIKAETGTSPTFIATQFLEAFATIPRHMPGHAVP